MALCAWAVHRRSLGLYDMVCLGGQYAVTNPRWQCFAMVSSEPLYVLLQMFCFLYVIATSSLKGYLGMPIELHASMTSQEGLIGLDSSSDGVMSTGADASGCDSSLVAESDSMCDSGSHMPEEVGSDIQSVVSAGNTSDSDEGALEVDDRFFYASAVHV